MGRAVVASEQVLDVACKGRQDDIRERRSRSGRSHHGLEEVQVQAHFCTPVVVDTCHGGRKDNRHATPRCCLIRLKAPV